MSFKAVSSIRLSSSLNSPIQFAWDTNCFPLLFSSSFLPPTFSSLFFSPSYTLTFLFVYPLSSPFPLPSPPYLSLLLLPLLSLFSPSRLTRKARWEMTSACSPNPHGERYLNNMENLSTSMVGSCFTWLLLTIMNCLPPPQNRACWWPSCVFTHRTPTMINSVLFFCSYIIDNGIWEGGRFFLQYSYSLVIYTFTDFHAERLKYYTTVTNIYTPYITSQSYKPFILMQ